MTDEPRPDSICPDCGELLRQYADGYGHLRGWCKADRGEMEKGDRT